jgi:hypothetical protein
MTTTTQDQAQDQGTQQSTQTQPVRATWKQHGNPLKGFWFYGTQAKAPNAKGIKVLKVEVSQQGITLLTSSGRAIEGGAFGTATKFWAIVPADAPRQAAEPKPAKAPRTVAEGRVSAADKLAAALSGDSAHAPAPEGYEIRWPKPAFDLLKRLASHPDLQPWLVRCNTHGTTTQAKDTREGDSLGTAARRPEWCPGCKAEAASKAKAGAK